MIIRMNFFDPHVIAYAAAACIIVLAGYFVMSIFADSVRSIHKKVLDEERAKKELEKKNRGSKAA